MLDKNKNPLHSPHQGFFALGRQVTLEYYDCQDQVLLEKDTVEAALLKAARDSNATIISSAFHQFEPQGVSGVVIIAESHFTVHAWPEHNYAAVDIFTCGDTIDLDKAIDSMRDSFGSARVLVSSDQNRGILSQPQLTSDAGLHLSSPLNTQEPLPISWQKAWEKKAPWGVSTALDLYGCAPDIITDAKKLEEFAAGICQTLQGEDSFKEIAVDLDENPTGFCIHLGRQSGTVSGRLDNDCHTAYLDIFSCNYYEPRQVAEFAMSFFKSHHYKLQVSARQ